MVRLTLEQEGSKILVKLIFESEVVVGDYGDAILGSRLLVGALDPIDSAIKEMLSHVFINIMNEDDLDPDQSDDLDKKPIVLN